MATPKEQHFLWYGCSTWRKSSQAASNLYNGGAKLWTKNDLRDIEHQLAQSKKRKTFTVHTVDGKVLSIVNPMFNEQLPIWQPRVKFQEYWRLVNAQPDGPEDTYHCTYLVDWVNVSAERFRGLIRNPSSVFDKTRLAWKGSKSHSLLESQLRLVPVAKKVRKVVCFGLGDICRKPPEWTRTKASSDEQDATSVRPQMIQHSIALTIADVCRKRTGNEVQLMAQDPDYTDQSKAILRVNGVTIVGQHGAAGFAEIDDESVVFSAHVDAPLKQIIADVARPLMIISTGFETFNGSDKPCMDAESPRTVELWKQYERISFPMSPEDGELMGPMQNLYVYIKKSSNKL